MSSQNGGVEAPVRQGATTKDWQRQCEEEQRRETGWIGGPKWEVIFPRTKKGIVGWLPDNKVSGVSPVRSI